LNLRDVGAGYRIESGAFFSDWSAHNGEGGSDLDNEIWLTARWGWDDGRNFRTGFSGSAGRSTPKSTDPGGGTDWATLTGFDAKKIARSRMANFFLDWLDEPVRLSLEVTVGDTLQDDNNRRFRAGHLDIEFHAWRSVGILARYDVLSPRDDVPDNQLAEVTGGFAWRSRYDNSVLYLLVTKEIRPESVLQSPDPLHRGLLIWRITPTASSFPTAL
jgi:hypothetical protein